MKSFQLSCLYILIAYFTLVSGQSPTDYPDRVPGACTGDVGTQFDCGSGVCISFVRVRDCVPDCADGSDELCGENQVLCDTLIDRCGLNSCGKCVANDIANTQCQDRLYERLCTRFNRSEIFNCRSTNNCVLLGWLGDGVDDCGDWSDEDPCYTAAAGIQPCPDPQMLCSYEQCLGALNCSCPSPLIPDANDQCVSSITPRTTSSTTTTTVAATTAIGTSPVVPTTAPTSAAASTTAVAVTTSVVATTPAATATSPGGTSTLTAASTTPSGSGITTGAGATASAAPASTASPTTAVAVTTAPAVTTDAATTGSAVTTGAATTASTTLPGPRPQPAGFFLTCTDIQTADPSLRSGWYTVYPPTCTSATCSKSVYCEFENSGGGWTIIQRRFNGAENFARNWLDYKNGFGSVDAEHWIGLEYLYSVTKQIERTSEMLVELTNAAGQVFVAEYRRFSVMPENRDYRLRTGAYTGNSSNGLATNNLRPFGTLDRGIAMAPRRQSNCGNYLQAGWWFPAVCRRSLGNLNIPYEPVAGDEVLEGLQWLINGSPQRIYQSRMMFRDAGFDMSLPKDCADLQTARRRMPSGIYPVYIPGCYFKIPRCRKFVYCDSRTRGGGWTVIQRRVNGAVDFWKDWNDYKDGFGALAGSFWAGNEYVSKLTNFRVYELLVSLDADRGQVYDALYDIFSVDPEAANYALNLGQYSGDAGDDLVASRGRPFGTRDRDTDASNLVCGTWFHSGWWFDPNCEHTGDLNVPFRPVRDYDHLTGIMWDNNGTVMRPTRTAMMVRPIDFTLLRPDVSVDGKRHGKSRPTNGTANSFVPGGASCLSVSRGLGIMVTMLVTIRVIIKTWH